MSNYDKGLLAMRRQELLRPIAEENEKLSQGRGKKGSPNLANLKIDTRKEAAKEAGIGHGTLDAVRVIRDAIFRPGREPR